MAFFKGPSARDPSYCPHDLPKRIECPLYDPPPQHKISSQALSFYFLNSSEEFNSLLQKYLQPPTPGSEFIFKGGKAQKMIPQGSYPKRFINAYVIHDTHTNYIYKYISMAYLCIRRMYMCICVYKINIYKYI